MIERDPAGAVERIVCDGRAVDTTLTARGPTCGKPFERRWLREPLDSQARAAGWAIGPDDTACCPSCRRPDRSPVDVSAYRSDPGPPRARLTPDPRYL